MSRIVTRRGSVSHVEWSGGELAADAVVFAGDASALGEGLLGDDVRHASAMVKPADRSLSAVTFSFLAREAPGSLFPFAHHNVFFPDGSDAGAAEHESLFAPRGRRMPDDPTVYVCAQDRGPFEASTGGERGPERFFAILNAPADGDARPLSDEDLERCKDRMISRLHKSGAWLDISELTVRTPTDFARAYPGSGGALYGPASHGSLSALNRSGARTKVKGLYLVGGSVHPGAGVPMAASRCSSQELGEPPELPFRYALFCEKWEGARRTSMRGTSRVSFLLDPPFTSTSRCSQRPPFRLERGPSQQAALGWLEGDRGSRPSRGLGGCRLSLIHISEPTRPY